MKVLLSLTALAAWLFWLNHRARRGDRRARLALGMSLILVAAAHAVALMLLFGADDMLRFPGGRGSAPGSVAVGDDPVLWLLGGLLACGWPIFLLLIGVRELRREDAPRPPAAPRSPRRR
jgi:hypothetical protein